MAPALELVEAAQKGEMASVRRLLAAGVAVDGLDDEGFSPLNVAADEGHVAVAVVLLKAGADIDKAMTLGYGFPMGPLRLTDLVGLDVRLSIAEYLSGTLGPRFEPPALLRKMVEEGKLGRKSGEGFYDWSEGA